MTDAIKKGKRTQPKKRLRLIPAIIAGIVIIGLILFDNWLPYMLLSHYKFSVDNLVLVMADIWSN